MRVYHLTKKENLFGEYGIINEGLIPQCGERSSSIKDNRVGVSFTNNYDTLKVWWIYLYPNINVNDLCVLSFDIDKKDCQKTVNKTEFYTTKTIIPNEISIASFYNKITNEEIPFHLLDSQSYDDYEWGEKPKTISIGVIYEDISNLKMRNK